MFSNSRNSHFQSVYFIAGKCHTTDEAYRVIKDQREDRDTAIRLAEAGALRTRAKQMRAELVIAETDSEANRLEAQADLDEITANAAVTRSCYEEALREREFLDQVLAILEPLRRYRHLPDHEAMQACQREEWGLELLQRAQDYLLTGGIPTDQLAAMRLHPDWDREIYPRVMKFVELAKAGHKLPSLKPAFLMAIEKLLPASALPQYPRLVKVSAIPQLEEKDDVASA